MIFWSSQRSSSGSIKSSLVIPLLRLPSPLVFLAEVTISRALGIHPREFGSFLPELQFWQSFCITRAIERCLPFHRLHEENLWGTSFLPLVVPNPPRWENLAEAWGTQNFNLFLFNTIIKYAIPVTIGTLLSSAIVAYGFARIKWLGRDVFFAVCLATIMIPFQVTMVPLFIIFKKLGWINTYLPLVIPAFFGNPYFIFLLRQFFKGIPEELSDAARIDGANEL